MNSDQCLQTPPQQQAPRKFQTYDCVHNIVSPPAKNSQNKITDGPGATFLMRPSCFWENRGGPGFFGRRWTVYLGRSQNNPESKRKINGGCLWFYHKLGPGIEHD